MSFGCAPTAIAAAMPKCFRSWNRNAGRKRRLPPRFSHSPSPIVWSVGTHSRLRKFVLDNEPPSPPRKIKSSLDSTGMRALAVNRVEKAVITPASGTSKRVIWEQLDREARQAFPGLDLLLDSSRSHRPNEARRCTRVSERIGGRGRPRSGRELVELTEGRTGPGLGSAPRRVVTPRPLEHSRSLP